MKTDLTGHEDAFSGLKIRGITSETELYKVLATIIPNHVPADDLHFLCIGTDRVTGDAYGPLVGSYLEEKGFKNVTGTIDEPCHGTNLQVKFDKIPQGKFIVAIDACVGRPESVGTLQAVKGALNPGTGVNKDLGEYGDIGIMAIVNVGGFLTLANTRLSVVMNLARITANAIHEVLNDRSIVGVPKRQAAALKAIQNHIDEYGCSPTVRELCDIMGVKSVSTVYNYLLGLRQKGYVTWKSDSPRTLQILKKEA